MVTEGRTTKLVVGAVVCTVGAAVYMVYSRCKERGARVVVVFCGKRKSGKDYCTDALLARLPSGAAEIGRLSGPLKKAYAEEKGLDYEELLAATEYKERYRADMIKWGEERRRADPGYFGSLVLKAARAKILIVSDARRISDVDFFKKHCSFVYVVRVEASIETRQQRGWAFTTGVDDAESECGLDHYHPFDFVLRNDPGQQAVVAQQLQAIASLALRRS